jgi:hypothetical protein
MKKVSMLFAFLLGMVSVMTFPGTVQAQVPQNLGKPSAAEQKKLNTFFSNFSEVFVEAFSQDSLGDQTLITFGVAHNYRNRSKLFERTADGAKAKIKAIYVDQATQKYFDRKIEKHQSVGDYEYKGGYYYLTEASGEMLQFSQVERVVSLGNKRYAVDVNVYSSSSGWTGNVHATPASWKKSGDEAPQLSQRMKATIAITTGADGKTSYALLEYRKN